MKGSQILRNFNVFIIVDGDKHEILKVRTQKTGFDGYLQKAGCSCALVLLRLTLSCTFSLPFPTIQTIIFLRNAGLYTLDSQPCVAPSWPERLESDGLTLNKQGFGMLYGNHINIVRPLDVKCFGGTMQMPRFP